MRKRSEIGKVILSLGILCVIVGVVMFGIRFGIPTSDAAGASAVPTVDVKVPPQVDVKADQGKAAINIANPSTPILPPVWLRELDVEEGELILVAGRSHVLRFAKSIGRVAVSDPEVLDFLMLSPTEVLLNARQHGTVNLIIWDTENNISNIDVNVINDPTILKKLIDKIDPNGKFEVYPSRDVFVVEGEATSVGKAKEIADAANAFAEGSISLVRVKDTKQILLQVRFIQVDLVQNFDFGIDWEHSDVINEHIWVHRFQPGGTNADMDGNSSMTLTNKSRAITHDINGLNNDDVYQFHVFGNMDTHLSGYLKAIEQKGNGKTIARPNLIVKDGEEASFLVGGEAAVVVTTADDIDVEYKEYGTRLTFTAEILYDDRIRLTMEPEVSAIDETNSVVVNDVNIPSFVTTKVKTMVEMAELETVMIGGLLRQQETVNETGVPFLRRIPVFGKLFESLDKNSRETELLVLVTPRFVTPEGDPIQDHAPEYDVLSKATEMLPRRIADDQADAIEEYIKNNRRYWGGYTGKPGEGIAFTATEIKGPEAEKLAKLPKVDSTSSLKELEEALNSISKERKAKAEPEKKVTPYTYKPKLAKTAQKRSSSPTSSEVDEEANRGYLLYKGSQY